MENDKLRQLKNISEKLLDPKIEAGELKTTLEELKSLLVSITQLDYESTSNRQNIQLPTGTAISPVWAAMCLEDIERSKVFMQSLHQAVKDVKKSTTISAVKILYAGTGPFATLVLPLISRFSPKELHFVFLEANLVSIEILKKVVSALKINDYVADFYHCDAANFILPDHIKDCDIVLIECLQHALAREPQVAISYNLLPQMSGNPILIPEEIELSAAILDYRFKFNDENQLAPNSKIEYQSPPLFRINKEEIKKNKRSASENLIFTPSEWRFDRAVISEENNTLSILTKIKVYKEHELPKNASGLTLPLYLADLIREKDITGVKAQYEIGLEPGLKVSYL